MTRLLITPLCSGDEAADREASAQEEARAARRALCPTCRRIVANCICAALPAERPLPLGRAAGMRILILQHPAEAKEFKNTVGILELCLPEGAVVVRRGKLFGPRNCPELPEVLAAAAAGRAFLLFPDDTACTPADLAPPSGPGGPASSPRPIDWLVVLDGTWTACKRMFRGNAERLAPLRRLAIDAAGPSRHRIRVQPQEGYLCTLEAVAVVLAAVEGGEAGERLAAGLLRPLDAVCATWAANAGWGHPGELEDGGGGGAGRGEPS
eukprot:tig00001493_g8987.t1